MESRFEQRPVVFVTGCAAGLGRALVKQLYTTKRYRLVAGVRDAKSKEMLAQDFPPHVNFRIEVVDVTKKSDRELLVEKILREWKGIDILINNAAISYRSVTEHMDDDSEVHQMNVNYFGPMGLIRQFIPIMREQRSGKIINISSVSGLVAMPTMASYSASKHALEGASEALWYEMKPYGISVSIVQPGFIRSRSFEKIYFSRMAGLSRDIGGPYSDYYRFMGQFVEKLMLRSLSTPETIAEKILELIEKKSLPLWVPVTLDAILFYWMRKILPRSLFHRLMYRLLPHINEWGKKPYSRTIFGKPRDSHSF